MNFYEKTVRVDSIFKGKVIRVDVEHVELPNGNITTREVVRHPGAVAVIAFTPENRLIAVRQFRKPLNKTIIEIPAGKLEQGENPLACAKRELLEETGYKADSMKFVTSFYTSPGFADEFLYIYEAEGLTAGNAEPDADEFVDLLELDLEEANRSIQTGQIIDAKTILAIYYWQNKILMRDAAP
jgi:ADP-ribose pyrophosphatase